ncbi:glycine betaine ABC transporter substrate-binding protein [Terribacillus saccharophilus]|uniref:glycine betaine ABC transporter substrate-binding protein n=1 Tax=Terribacillus saccharophilus TaxID=361277 RepID=UPI002989CE95|nr:glycine betaine ABC transporter substrate-binding protein [Terribacillus saccharophilus]MCM3226133.1 glycine/betaine ABC transporter [Terribacillus saccharophilus]
MIKKRIIGIISVLSFVFVLTGCGSSESNSEAADLGDELDYTITGIEPGAGAMGLAEDTIEGYENLNDWTLFESSTAGMLTELGEAIDNEEPIVIVGWNPHWMFASYDLKYLEDPKGTMGRDEGIHTIARTGLEEDYPEAYEVLDRFNWKIEDMEAVMNDAQDMEFAEAATKWIDANQDKVKEWTEGVDKVQGKEFELVATPWDSELASGEVIKQVLEQQGFEVTVTPVDPAVLFQSIAQGEGDASVAPWLPVTHGPFFEQYKDDIIDLGANLTGAKNGIVVPSYMDIDSIEDLPAK